MDRRTFIATASATALLPAAANAIGLEYTPGLVKERIFWSFLLSQAM